MTTTDREQALGGWQTIDTAPRDGTRFLAFCKESGQDDWGPGETCVIYHDGRTDYPYRVAGVEDRLAYYTPTHWMPLPAAPDTVSTDEQVGEDQLRVIAAAYEIVPALGDTRSVRTIISAPPPARHHNLCGLEYHLKERGMIADEQTQRNSGFILSDGTYADRKRACKVAIAAGQVTADKMTVKGTLFSEDLW